MFAIWADLFAQEWLIPASDDAEPMDREVAGVRLFDTRKEAFAWYSSAQRLAWYKDTGDDDLAEVEARASELVAAMEAGEYPRNPGYQCMFCPVQDPCLGTQDPAPALRAELVTGLGRPPTEDEPTGTRPDRLTQQQETIVDRVRGGGLTVVSAGAGSGKTHTMVSSVLRLIQERGASVDQFVMITFTNKAADELRGRIESALQLRRAEADRADKRFWLDQQERLSAAHVGTIHGFCSSILREFGYALPLPRSARRTQSAEAFANAVEQVTDAAFAGHTMVDEVGLAEGETPIVATALSRAWASQLSLSGPSIPAGVRRRVEPAFSVSTTSFPPLLRSHDCAQSAAHRPTRGLEDGAQSFEIPLRLHVVLRDQLSGHQ